MIQQFLRVSLASCILALLILLPCAAATFSELDPLSGQSYSDAAGVSADGAVVVGTSWAPVFPSTSRATCWTQPVGVGADLGGFTGGSQLNAAGASASGSVIVGTGRFSSGPSEAFAWTQATGAVGLGCLPGGVLFGSSARATSADGSVVVGESYYSSSGGVAAFRWTAASGMVNLGFLPGAQGTLGPASAAYAVSADGSTTVGYSNTSLSGGGSGGSGPVLGGANTQAVRWTQTGEIQGLGYVPGGSNASRAYGVSADGSVIVGSSNSPLGTEAFRWTGPASMVSLGDLPGGAVDSQGNAVSADGSVIVGFGTSNLGQEAFIWDETHGMRRLESVLQSYGLYFSPNLILTNATGISADGRTIVGQCEYTLSGATMGWVATIPEPSSLLLLVTACLASLPAIARKIGRDRST